MLQKKNLKHEISKPLINKKTCQTTCQILYQAEVIVFVVGLCILD